MFNVDFDDRGVIAVCPSDPRAPLIFTTKDTMDTKVNAVIPFVSFVVIQR